MRMIFWFIVSVICLGLLKGEIVYKDGLVIKLRRAKFWEKLSRA